jgi:hypothetical protein
MNKLYTGKDPNQMCVPVVAERLRGFIRKSAMPHVVTANAEITAEASN